MKLDKMNYNQLLIRVKVWRLVAVLMLPLVLIFGTYFFYGNPIPHPAAAWPDRGDANYGVYDQYDLLLLDFALSHVVGNVYRRFTMKVDPSVASVYSNGLVFMAVKREKQDLGLDGTGPSFAVSDPYRAAEKMAAILRAGGKPAKVISGFLDEESNRLYLVDTGGVLTNSKLAFRYPVTKMGTQKQTFPTLIKLPTPNIAIPDSQ